LPDQSQMIKETTDQNLLLDIAQNNLNPWNRKAAVEELSDQKILAQAALNASDKYIRKIAVIKLSNQEALAQVVLNASDQDTRLSAVKKLTDQKILARIAEKHSDAIIRNLAGKKLPDQIQMIQKVTDQNLLLDIAQNNLNPRNRKAAVEKLTDQDALAKIALNDSYSDVRLSATEKLTDQNILAKVALNDSGRYVRQLAAEKLTDQKTLAQIALNDSEQIVRKAAIEKLTDQKELAQIALNASDRNVRYQAVEKLTDQKTLAQIALNDSDLIFRRTAAKKLTDQKTLAQIVLNDPYLDDITIEKLTDQKLLTQIALNQSFPYRRSVIEKLTDQDALAQIALNDPDEMNRLIARGKLTDQKILAETAMDAHDMSVRVEAAEKLTDQKAMGQFIIKELNSYFQHLPKHIYEGEGCFPYTNVGQVWDKVHDQQVWGEIASIDTTCREFYTRVISKLTDQNLLAELVLRLTDPFPINEAMEKLTDQEALAKVASNHANIIFRRRAAEKLTDQKILGEFALKASDVMIRRNAVEKLTDPKVLIKVVQNDTDAAIRETAITFLNNKINELEKQIRGLTEQDSYEDVFPAIEMLAELIENTPPVTDDQLSENLDILEHIYKGIRKYPDADPLLKKTLTVLEKIKPLDELIPDLRDMGLFYVASGEFEKAGGFFSRALEIDNMLIDRILGTASEDKKISFISSKKDGLHFFLSLVSQHLKENPAAKKEAFNAWLRRKGVILEANKLFQDPLLYADNPRAEKVFQELSEVRKQLSDLVFTKKDADYSETLSELEEKKQKLETDLSRISQPFALKQRIERAYCEKVAWVLNENSVLLEFATIRAYNFKAAEEPQWEPDRYLVFVLHAGKCDTLALIDLGDAETIDNAVANYKKLVTMQSTGMRMEVSAEKVYNLIFAPLKKELGDAKEIFISPDSDLSLIPFEMIQDPDGKFLIEDYTFSYLAAGRDIMGFDQIQEKGGKSVIIGDPDFETAGGKFSAINKLTANQEHVFTRSPDMTNFNFGRLPETKKEAEIIYSLIGKENSELYTDKHATEKVLFQKNAPKLLHLATHGFFLSNIDIEETQSSEFYHKNPLLRSGIALAGANAALKSENPADSDGIVTAEKILGLKLRGTDTVVLSACDTGMGDVRAGEGIYGLRRAFTQAGTKSLIMSMWPVPDKESRELMTEFYKNILSGKMKRNEALRQAVLKQKETVNQRYGYPSPLFWGAFVFMGEP
jgi:CHAT domain-containing protein